jgi:hypothetical protein
VVTPFVKALENKKSSEITLRLNSYEDSGKIGAAGTKVHGVRGFKLRIAVISRNFYSRLGTAE